MNVACLVQRLRLPGGPTLALLSSLLLGHGGVGNAVSAPAADDKAAQPWAPRPAAGRPAAEQGPPATPGARLDQALNLVLLQRGGPRHGVADVFAGRSWAPPPPADLRAPPPVAPQPAVATEPSAPPLPFAYVGKLQEDGERTTYFLERGPQVLAVAAGEAIDAQYRLAEASPDELAFVYLPLQTRQLLRLPP